MPGLIFMLPIALAIALVFLGFFLWSVKNGDYEDPEMPRYTMLHDEDRPDETIKARKKKA